MKAGGRVDYLDGLRGLAAMQVVLGHYVNAFMPSWFLKLGLLDNGDFAVFIFFVMSGLVLTPGFERDPGAFGLGIGRRIVRLGMPAAVACALGYLLRSAFPGPTAIAARIAGSSWLASFQAATTAHALADISGLTLVGGYLDTTMFGFLVPALFTVQASVDTPIWSLHIELWGSALVLLLVLVRAQSQRAYIILLTICAILIGGNALILFAVGSTLSGVTRAPWFSALLRARWRLPLACIVLALGVWATNDPNVPGLWRLHSITMAYSIVRPYSWFTWHTEVGAVLVFVAIVGLPEIHGLLSTRVPLWLGRCRSRSTCCIFQSC